MGGFPDAPFRPESADASPDKAADADRLAALQADAVVAELKVRNPGFHGNVTPTIESGVVVGIQFAPDKVTDVLAAARVAGIASA